MRTRTALGYPMGLKAASAPFLARLIRVVDTYDAMTSLGPIMTPIPAFDAAGTLIQSMSDQFGEDIVPKFIRFLGSPYVSAAS
jgi:HD-GYP domain-containing protein (c-di-GMP phosphodiesterase class II)